MSLPRGLMSMCDFHTFPRVSTDVDVLAVGHQAVCAYLDDPTCNYNPTSARIITFFNIPLAYHEEVIHMYMSD